MKTSWTEHLTWNNCCVYGMIVGIVVTVAVLEIFHDEEPQTVRDVRSQGEASTQEQTLHMPDP